MLRNGSPSVNGRQPRRTSLLDAERYMIGFLAVWGVDIGRIADLFRIHRSTVLRLRGWVIETGLTGFGFKANAHEDVRRFVVGYLQLKGVDVDRIIDIFGVAKSLAYRSRARVIEAGLRGFQLGVLDPTEGQRDG